MYVDLTNMNSGFCDRLRQLTFCIAYEKLQNNKFKFINIYEKKNPECPYYISELIKIKNFKLRNVKKKNLQTIKMDPFNSDISIENCHKYNSKKVDNSKLLEIWKKTYTMIHPKKKIITKVNKIIKYKKYVAIHVRLTDKLVSFKDYIFELPKKDVITNFQIKSFYKNINNILDKKIKYIYIASDENILKKKLENKLINQGYKIIERDISYNPNKLRQTSGYDFVIDLFSLSKADYIISSTGGNVPLTAKLISKRKIKYIKWTNYKTIYILLNILRRGIYKLRSLF